MDRLYNALKLQAGKLDTRTAQPRFGTVTSVDPNSATARVILQPDGVLSGWLPVLSSWVGNGWGMVCNPSPGDQVLVVAQEGRAQHGVIVGRAFSEACRPPAAPAGELWLVHNSGSHIKLANDGSIRIKGDLHVDGYVFDKHGSLDRLRGNYNKHSHMGGGSGLPTHLDPTDDSP